MSRRGRGRKGIVMEKYKERIPILMMKDKGVEQAWGWALDNLLRINTVPCPRKRYNRTGLLAEKPGLMIRAGGDYPTPWTRDAAVNVMNAACFLEPEVARDTLWAVCERVDGKLCFQMDDQSWDKVVWVTGAWVYYLATGDSKFLAAACETAEHSLAMLEERQFHPGFGLFMGGSFFNDGIAGYPAALHEEGNPSSFVGDHPGPGRIMTLSTNCLYYQAYRILERMTALTGEAEKTEGYRKRADTLRDAINRHLWRKEEGRYSYFLYPDGSTDDSQEGCGISFAILSGVCGAVQAKRILEGCYRSPRGLVSVWPPFAGISSEEKPLRHNNIIWPFVNGYFVTAAAKYGYDKIVGEEIRNLAVLAREDGGTFSEIYHAGTGKADGGWQCGRPWKSVPNQTWSATGFIRAIVFGVFGITLGEEGIIFRPCLPEGFGPAVLEGIRFRDTILDIRLTGAGSRISSMRIDGEEADGIEFRSKGRHRVEIRMEEA